MTSPQRSLSLDWHPTPEVLVSQLTSLAVRWSQSRRDDGPIRVLDLCAGDGRLGRATKAALEEAGHRVEVTFVEIDATWCAQLSADELGEVVNADIFSDAIGGGFDLVVSNPPFRRVRRKDALSRGLLWREMVAGAGNLYGMAILKGLSVLAGRGAAIFVCPFSWVVGADAGRFRETVLQACGHIDVHAHRSRSTFVGVHQDVGVQLFSIRGAESRSECRLTLSYDSDSPESVSMPAHPRSQAPLVHVGQFVWNQHRECVGSEGEGLLPVVYGGNIRDEGLSLDVARYLSRQYLGAWVEGGRFPVVSGPAVLVRRVLRGRPGAWIVDCAVVESDFRGVIENHVLVAPCTSSSQAMQLRAFFDAEIPRGWRNSGSPMLSVGALAAIRARWARDAVR